MIETFAVLLFAHTLADFVFQTGWMAARKGRPPVLLLHGAIVLVTAQAAIGRIDSWELLALAAVHIAIDAVKARLVAAEPRAFILDQCAHLTTLLVLAWARPGLFAGGCWGDLTLLPPLMTYVAGAILTIRAGGFAVGLLMIRYQPDDLPKGLPNGGRIIGVLERALIFLFVLVGHPAGIGFLIAAKSVLRFDTASKNQHASEYVIIGTLASFGWALAASYATLALAGLLPPIEIAGAAP